MVTGAGGTTGGFTINTILNALTEPESNGGPSNNTPDTAQPLDGSAITFVGQDNRMAVLGTIANASDNADCYSFQLQAGESATVVASALNSKAVRFALEDDQGNVLGFSQGGTADISAVLNNFVASSDGTYYVLVSGAIGVQYNLVVTRGADFSTAPNNTLATAQDLTATELSGNGKLGGVLGYLTNPSGAIGTDFYSVHANVGDNLHFATSTPRRSGEFINNLYPELLLYDPNGNLVAVAAGNASDGRNSVIDFTVPAGDTGTWTIEVTSSPNTPMPTYGEYGLLVTGATGACRLRGHGTTPPLARWSSRRPTSSSPSTTRFWAVADARRAGGQRRRRHGRDPGQRGTPWTGRFRRVPTRRASTCRTS